MDSTTFNVSILLGCVLFVLSVAISYAMKRFGKIFLLSKHLTTFSFNLLIKYLFSASWLIIGTFSYFGLILGKEFHLNSMFMILVISTLCCAAILSGVVGDLFPTHLRFNI